MSPDIHRLRLAEQHDSEIAEFRTLSGWAIAGLIMGLLSPLALLGPMLWVVPMAGLTINGWALWQIKKNAPALMGRKAALAGVWFSICFLVAGPSDWFYYRRLICAEARQVALLWFDLLAKNRPEMAFQLTLHIQNRRPLDERIWNFYKDSQKWREELKNYVAPSKPGKPPRLVRTLLALGDAAKVSYICTFGQFRTNTEEIARQLYAVTFVDSGEQKTFFVAIELAPIRMDNGHVAWRIISTQGGVNPDYQESS